jgi:hypothetical protein
VLTRQQETPAAAMANQAVRLWEAMLQGLNDIPSGHYPDILDLVTKLDMPALPKATWKRLVLDMQVREAQPHPVSTAHTQRADRLSCVSSPLPNCVSWPYCCRRRCRASLDCLPALT